MPQPAKTTAFHDDRGTYMAFAQQTDEKPQIGDMLVTEHVAPIVTRINGSGAPMSIFDAGVGNGAVLTHVLSGMHHHCPPETPFLAVGKEISDVDVAAVLQRMPEHFAAHPATALVLTNLPYATAPTLRPPTVEAQSKLVWHDVRLTGTTPDELRQQLSGLQGFLQENWGATHTDKGMVADKPVVLVLSHMNAASGLHAVLPQQRQPTNPAYDLMIASQPWRSRTPADRKASTILAPLARNLNQGGRLVVIQARGGNPAEDLIHSLWPDERPFPVGPDALIAATKTALGADSSKYNFRLRDQPLQYRMQDFANTESSAVVSAFRFAVYAAQMPHGQVLAVPEDQCRAATEAVLNRNQGQLSFLNEVFSIERT